MNADNYTMQQVNKVLKDLGSEIRRDDGDWSCDWYVMERCPHFTYITDGDWPEVFERACDIMREHGVLYWLGKD